MAEKIGIIADTHGLLRPEALMALTHVDAIIHAGDIGKPEVLAALAEVAPLTAIKGNIDTAPWAARYKDTEVVQVAGHSIYVIHDLKELDIEPQGRFSAVVCGHSHKPRNESRDGVLYFNPGSAGPRRFKLPIAVGILTVSRGEVVGEVIELDITN